MKKELIIISAVWCPSCLILNKQLKKIKEQYQNLTITKLDYDFDEDIVKSYNIGKTLPVMILKEDNKEINRLIGEKTYEEINIFLGSDK